MGLAEELAEMRVTCMILHVEDQRALIIERQIAPEDETNLRFFGFDHRAHGAVEACEIGDRDGLITQLGRTPHERLGG